MTVNPRDLSPYVTAFLADRSIVPGSLDVTVDPRDEMLGYLVDALDGDRDRALFTYFRTGLSIADAMLQVVRWRFGGLDAPDGPGSPGGITRVLDFASGYGRISRFLVRDLPQGSLWVSDIYADGVRFQQDRFGVKGVVSTMLPIDFSIEETFDAVLVTSLFTHLSEERFRGWLRVLFKLLKPGGVLVFSTHHPSLLEPVPEIPESGLLFRENSESGTLDTSDYGSAWVTEAFVRDALERAVMGTSSEASMLRLARGLCNYQDLYVVVPEADADFSGLRFTGEPHLFLEHSAVTRPDGGLSGLELHGWAAVRTGEVAAVEVMLNGETLASFPVTQDRPEVAAMLGDPRYTRSGWGGFCPLPADLSRASAILLVRILDSRGVSHPVRAGSIESLLLESSRNDARSLAHELLKKTGESELASNRNRAEIEWLRATIEEMKKSTFWKGREAWFRLKRALGLTTEA